MKDSRSICLLTAVLAGFMASAHAAERPNILFILVDNLGYGELGCYGGGELRGAPTPNVDKLASEGLRLTNFNVETQCTPSRAAIMTGRYAIRTGNGSVPIHTPLYGLVQWEITMAEMLADIGYKTGCFGKWHLGQSEGRFPTDQGFEEWYGIPNSSDEAVWPGSPDFEEGGAKIIPPTYVLKAKQGQKPEKVKLYDRKARAEIDGELVGLASDFMRRSTAAKKPFFAFVPLTQIHMPILPGKEFEDRTGNGPYADVVVELDANIGKLLGVLDELEQRDDTIVMICGDNGAESNSGFPGIWRGALFSPYEGGLRTPFIARWPEKIPAGRVSNEIVHGLDLLPTVAAMTGGAVPEDRAIDGVDQKDFFTGGTDKSAREGFVIYIGNTLVGAKWRNWKMLSKTTDNAFTPTPDDAILKTYSVPRVFNLLEDPREEESVTIHSTWVRWPVSEIVLKHAASLKEFPPIKGGAPDPYSPPKRSPAEKN